MDLRGKNNNFIIMTALEISFLKQTIIFKVEVNVLEPSPCYLVQIFVTVFQKKQSNGSELYCKTQNRST